MANFKYTLEAVERVCERIADGESVRVICQEPRAEGIPTWRSFFRWVSVYPEAKRAYEAARFMRSDLLWAELLMIADGREHPGRSLEEDRMSLASRRWRLEGLRTTEERRAVGAARSGMREPGERMRIPRRP